MKWDEILKVVPVAVLTVLIAITLSWSQSKYGDAASFLAILFIVLIALFFLAYWAVKGYNRDSKIISEKLELFAREIRALETTITSNSRFSWILTAEQLINIEREKSKLCKEIWIITPDLSSDTGSSPWIPAIQQNLIDGISYKYICVRQIGTTADARGLKKTFESKLDMCEIAAIELDDYQTFPHRHIVIYDPMNVGGQTDCYAEIEGQEHDLWIQISPARRNEIIGKAEAILNASSEPLQTFLS